MVKPVPTYNKYGRRPAIRITDHVEKKGIAGTMKFITDNNLDCTTPCISIQISPNNAGAGTLKEYHSRWAELRKFCIRTGDYQSAALVDRERCPSNPYPLKPGTLIQYMDFKCGSSSSKVKVYNSTEDLLDVDGKVIFCQDTWHSPVTIQKFRSSIVVLHQAYDHLRDAYKDVCKQCVEANAGISQRTGVAGVGPTFYGSCNVHANNPQLRPIGNTATDRDFHRAYNSKLEWAARYIRKGSVQLLPGEIRTLRAHLVHTEGVRNFQVYVMILLGIKLFLRADELISLRVEDFDPKYQCLDSKAVKAIAVKVLGKSDKKVVYLNLYSDDVHPEFCPVRHLLVYMAHTGILSGYIFPSPQVLATCGTTARKTINNGEQWEYGSWLSEIKRLHRDILGRPTVDGALGTHTLRKTAYLFAIWGTHKYLGINVLRDGPQPLPVLCFANILRSARHKSMNHADTYQNDCVTLLNMVNSEQYAEQHAVSPWQSIAFHSLHTAETIYTPSRVWQKSLPDLAVFYVTDILRMPVDSTNVQILQLITAAMRTEGSGTTKEEFLKLLGRSCSSEVGEQLKELFAKTVRNEVEISTQRLQAVYKQQLDTMALRTGANSTNKRKLAPTEASNDISTVATVPNSMATASLPTIYADDFSTASGVTLTTGILPDDTCPTVAKKSKKSTVPRTDIPERCTYKKATTHNDRVQILVDLRSKYAGGLLGIVNADRVWYQKYVPRVSKCVEVCYGGSVPTFVEKKCVGFFKPYEYSCPVCSVQAGGTPQV